MEGCLASNTHGTVLTSVLFANFLGLNTFFLLFFVPTIKACSSMMTHPPWRMDLEHLTLRLEIHFWTSLALWRRMSSIDLKLSLCHLATSRGKIFLSFSFSHNFEVQCNGELKSAAYSCCSSGLSFFTSSFSSSFFPPLSLHWSWPSSSFHTRPHMPCLTYKVHTYPCTVYCAK